MVFFFPNQLSLSSPLEILNSAFVFLSRGARPEGSQVAPFPGPRIFFPRVQSVLSRLKSPDHRGETFRHRERKAVARIRHAVNSRIDIDFSGPELNVDLYASFASDSC